MIAAPASRFVRLLAGLLLTGLPVCLTVLASGDACRGQAPGDFRSRYSMQSRQPGPGRAVAQDHRSLLQLPTKDEYPLMVKGFDVVELRDRRQWKQGQAKISAVFDGREYRFVGERERAIFLASPERYAPALDGDCVVTYAETGRRVAGEMKFGVLNGDRLYFFAGAAEQDRFQQEPTRYASADLVIEGNCPVCLRETHREVAGIRSTEGIYRGMRFRFVGMDERRRFFSNPSLYLPEGLELLEGADRLAASGPSPGGSMQGSTGNRGSAQANTTAEQLFAKAKELPKSTAPADDEATSPTGPQASASELQSRSRPAIDGYCPVSMRDRQQWIRGSEAYQVQYGGRTYLFAGSEEKKHFLALPEYYLPAFGGDCVVSRADRGRIVAGSPRHALMYSGQLYLFAGDAQKEAFINAPDAYAAGPTREARGPGDSTDRSEAR